MRCVGAIGVVAILAIGYLILLSQFNVSEIPIERHFEVAGSGGPPVQIYIEPISIDALNDSMQMRVSLGSTGPRIASSYARPTGTSCC